MAETIYFEKRDHVKYPEVPPFNPSYLYPENPFPDEISTEDNIVYDMVRATLLGMKLDVENFNTSRWNPLGKIIQKSNRVLIKPNLVCHKNENLHDSINSLVTHPSIIRAVIDFVIIALDGEGTIIIGDAPIQSCNLEKLIDENGLNELIRFYSEHEVKVDLIDFRAIKSHYQNGLLRTENSNYKEFKIVNLFQFSEFSNLDESRIEKLRISNYKPSDTVIHHKNGNNEYLIASEVLKADVIINIPKPKSHRIAGATISLKNMIGVIGHKSWIPHHSQGSLHEGGDEYQNISYIKRNITNVQQKIDQANSDQNYLYSYLLVIIRKFFSLCAKLMKIEKNVAGCWYKNDTVWRTILDINRAVLFSDREGNLQNEKMRKQIIIGDMIICGEGEGPLAPEGKFVGIVALGFNSVTFDEAVSTILGFNSKKIPHILNAKREHKYPLVENDEYLIQSNYCKYNNKSANDITIEDSYKFKPSYGWCNYLEN